jgi:hypothetical protein
LEGLISTHRAAVEAPGMGLAENLVALRTVDALAAEVEADRALEELLVHDV